MEAILPIMPGEANPVALARYNDARAEGAYKDLEALFVNELMKEMRKTVPNDGLFEKSHAEEIYQGMLDNVFSEAIAESGQLGIAKQIAEQVRIQELQNMVRPEASLEPLVAQGIR